MVFLIVNLLNSDRITLMIEFYVKCVTPSVTILLFLLTGIALAANHPNLAENITIATHSFLVLSLVGILLKR